ncbi:hypothetical protein EHI44_30790 [Rhizobium leguminosarum]|nr:hypothetical protein [Rhizobium leguminosarum]RWY79903.1 hypothetical protein EHI44_30790 [Rhizobium leguminosarum]
MFAANATKVALCLFDDGREKGLERVELPEYTDEVWHGTVLPNARPGMVYAYRVRRGPSRRPTDQSVAFSPDAQHAGDAVLLTRQADAIGR